MEAVAPAPGGIRIQGLAAGLAARILLGMLVAGGALAATEAFPEARRKALEDAITGAFERIDAPGLAVGIWIPGEGTLLTTRGVSNPSTGTAMTGAEHFRIGSITKTFTVTALLQLVDDGRLSLDDPVGRYLPFVPNGDHITLRMLANMTSGLFSYSADEAWAKRMLSDPSRVYTPRDLADAAFRHPPQAPPGDKWEYVNTNTVLLGMVIEKVTGRPVQEFFQERIFKPLGLTRTLWPTNGVLPEPYAHGVTRQTLDDSRADATHWCPSWAFTAGQLVSTRDDLKTWARACALGTLVSPRLQKERLTWVTLPPNTADRHYGLGIGGNHDWLGHTGELPGYNVSAFHLPSRDATIVVLVNSDIPKNGKSPTAIVLQAVTSVITPDHVITE